MNNTYIVIGEDKKSALLVDPASDAERIVAYLTGQSLELKAMLITHGHFDHIGAVDRLVRALKVPVYAHEEEGRVMADPMKNLSTYFTSSAVTGEATETVADKDCLDFGSDLQFSAICVPGHSPKSLCYYSADAAVLFSGDTLFAGGIGRTDLYDGPGTDLKKNIQERLLHLPDATVIYPGHGEHSTIGKEKAYNPYLQ